MSALRIIAILLAIAGAAWAFWYLAKLGVFRAGEIETYDAGEDHTDGSSNWAEGEEA